MNWMVRYKIMPVLIVVAALSFGVRFGDFVSGVSAVSKLAYAADDADTPLGIDPQVTDELNALSDDMSSPSVMDEDGPRTAGAMAKPSVDAGESIDWRDADDTDFEFSETRMEMFEDLSERRKKVEQQERSISVKEALLKTAEKEINQKYQELVSLRSEIKDLLVTQKEEEKARTASLVKIYEGMKPKEAARIFDTLDMDVLLQVISGMSERKSAPIMASMSPDRARNLTIMLMEQKSLPSLSEDMM